MHMWVRTRPSFYARDFLQENETRPLYCFSALQNAQIDWSGRVTKMASGLVKAKKYDWQDSNLALFGSDTEKQVRKQLATFCTCSLQWARTSAASSLSLCSCSLCRWRKSQLRLSQLGKELVRKSGSRSGVSSSSRYVKFWAKNKLYISFWLIGETLAQGWLRQVLQWRLLHHSEHVQRARKWSKPRGIYKRCILYFQCKCLFMFSCRHCCTMFTSG